MIAGGMVVRRLRRRHREKLTTPSELLPAVAIGQEAIVADALKALGQKVEKAVIGDGDATGVSREVGQDLFRPVTGILA
jgi:hypothetical protein